MSARDQKRMQLFRQARSLDDTARRELLDRACPEDAELRRELESLLAQEAPSSGILEEAWTDEERVGEGAATALEADRDLGHIGPYQLREIIGEGGMGVVYLAEQRSPIRRHVALKLIKWGLETQQLVARFESERQALAMMDHPGIAKVFEAGATEAGRPYFVMEHVRGVPITTYCDRGHLDLRDRLKLFTKMCDAVQHAHQKGVIHRDLKPSNVLVTERGSEIVPVVIDFGVAKATQHAFTDNVANTRVGVLIGTPEYMSPEQADATASDVDTRSDVYSLGVMLYELLTGALPLDTETLSGIGVEEIRRRIREKDPIRPSVRISTLGARASTMAANRRISLPALRRELSDDLDWITLKALEKDRARRYSSASELGADVGRYLNSLPVVAGPPSASYRAKKFVRRHRVGVAVGVTLGLALLVGSVGTTWGMLRAIRAEARAKDEATVATQLSDFLIGVFSGTNPLATAQDAKGDVKGPDLTAIELLRRGALRVRAELDARPLLQARLMGVMGMAFIELGATDSARPLIEDSLRLSQHDALSRAEGLVNLGHLKLEDGSASFGEVEVLAREALAVFTANDAEAEPGSLRALQLLAATLRYQDRLDEAIGVLYQRLGILERSPAGNEIRIAEALRDIAFQKVFKGELQQSTELLHRALELLESSVGPNHPSIGSVSTILGWVSVLSGRWDEAEVAGERALRIAEEYLGPTHVFVADALDALGSIYALEGKYREATEANDRCIQIKRSIYGQQTPKVAVTLQNSAWVRMKSGDYGAAERMYLEAFGLLGGLEKIKAPIFWKNFAALLCLQGRLSEAEKHFEVALAQAESWGPEHPSMVWVLNDFAQLRVAQGRLEDAEALTDRSVELAGKLHGQSHQDLAWGLHNRAAILLERGRFDQAEAMGRSALRMREDTLGASHPDVEESRRLLEKIEKLRAAGRTAPAKLNK